MKQRAHSLGVFLVVSGAALGLAGACASGENGNGTSSEGGSSPGGSGPFGGGGAGGSTGTVSPSGAGGEAGSTGAGEGGGCHVFSQDSCGDCMEEKCCAEVEVCMKDALCWECFTEHGATGCDASAAFPIVVSCVLDSCGAVVVAGPQGPIVSSNPCHFPPDDWECDPSAYDENYTTPNAITCDCACGPLPDPDCSIDDVADDCGTGKFCAACGCLDDGDTCS